MNHLIKLQNTFIFKGNHSSIGNATFAKDADHITLEKLVDLRDSLSILSKNHERKTLLDGFLVSIDYNRIIPKSRRVTLYFSNGSKWTSNNAIVGARFGYGKNNSIYHIITYFVPPDVMKLTLFRLNSCISLLETANCAKADNAFLNQLYAGKYAQILETIKMSKSNVGRMLVESANITSIHEPQYEEHLDENAVVTIYKTGKETLALMKELGIELPQDKIMDQTTLLLTPDEIHLLEEKAPYLIAMAVSDFSKLSLDDFGDGQVKPVSIPEPQNEPVIGVIDGPFDKSIYCAKWVEYHQEFSNDESIEAMAVSHGTEVTSLIVDGETINPWLKDGCGRFRVRHFGVTSGTSVLSFTLLKKIKKIVEGNPDIKVWNLSLGSTFEVKKNYISPVAALLDRLQYEYDVIFIVSGTNDAKCTGKMRMGDPADSINSIVVNAVKKNGMPASYTRIGPVLSFFRKPDISYYGGDIKEPLEGCDGLGETKIMGTSFAAPLITRKMAYMIYKLNLPREVAKALLIDSASKWNERGSNMDKKGFGIPPISIRNIVESQNDEIKFFVSGTADNYETISPEIPVPRYEDKYPYIAKATLCYFPYCDRNKGVDYTGTELDIHFGRVDKKNQIKSINDNHQADAGDYTNEKDARKFFRKWDNVKCIKEYDSGKKKAKKTYGSKEWRIQIKHKERIETQHSSKGTRYGVVVTLKAVDGKNRYDEFTSLCMGRGWLVVPIDIKQQIDIQQIAEEEIKWD